MIFPDLGPRPRSSPRSAEVLLYPAAAALGLLAAYGVLMNPPFLKFLLLFPALIFAVAISPERLFVGWLFFAPFVQGASSGHAHGHVFFKFLFFVPPLILVARMATGTLRHRLHVSLIDVLPAVYLAYILVRVALFPTDLSGKEASLRGIYGVVGIGIISYYFVAFGKTSDGFAISGKTRSAGTGKCAACRRPSTGRCRSVRISAAQPYLGLRLSCGRGRVACRCRRFY